MSEQTNNIQNNPEETQLTELEEKFCDLYVNGGVFTTNGIDYGTAKRICTEAL